MTEKKLDDICFLWQRIREQRVAVKELESFTEEYIQKESFQLRIYGKVGYNLYLDNVDQETIKAMLVSHKAHAIEKLEKLETEFKNL